jgi:retinol dehydrogenase 14
VAER